jgi:hypothetical protein
MLAALLAMTEEQCGDDTLAAIRFSRQLRKNPRGQRKLDAYMLDPANRAKIIARHREAAEILGITGGTRH